VVLGMGVDMIRSPKKVFITGIAGFIGFHTALALKKRGDEVRGIDDFNPYYDPLLKRKRSVLLQEAGILVEERALNTGLSHAEGTTHFLHLAAQAGVRYSLENPFAYLTSNLEGFLHVLEWCRHHPHVPLIYASSSSVYGSNTKTPYSPEDGTDHPVSFYGATKKCNEIMAESYHHLFQIPMTALRFFTVYGPWGRPDMAIWKFTEALLQDKPLHVYSEATMERDFTYIDDIVAGTIAALDWTQAGHHLFNLGNHQPAKLSHLISLLEKATGKQGHKIAYPKPPGDVEKTYADIKASQHHLGFTPRTSLEEGVARFVAWYQLYTRQ